MALAGLVIVPDAEHREAIALPVIGGGKLPAHDPALKREGELWEEPLLLEPGGEALPVLLRQVLDGVC